MATDWAADVKKYAPTADDGIIAGVVRYCGIALRNRDSSLVAFSDKIELDRVRTNFLKKKLGLVHSDAMLDAAIAAVGERMKADRTKNRVTVYYLLADNYKMLHLFEKKAAVKVASKSEPKTKTPAKAVPAKAATKGAAAAVAGAAAAQGMAKQGGSSKAAKPKPVAKISTSKSPARTGTASTKPVKPAAKAPAAKAVPAKSASKAAVKPAAAKVSVPATAAPAAKSAGAGAIAATAVGAAGLAAAGVAGRAASKAGETVSQAAGSAVESAGKVSAAVAGVAGAGLAGAAGMASGAADKAVGGVRKDSEEGGLGWLWLLLGLLLLGFAAWWIFHRDPASETGPVTEAGAVTSDVAAPAAAAASATDLAAAPAEGSVTIPTGAGVTSETRDGKPVVKVYFDSGKTDVAPAFGSAAGGLKAWLDGHAGSTLAVSGYNDATGNAARNAALSKSRAQAVGKALVASGIPEAAVALIKPENSTDTSVAKDAARRVEVTIK